MSRDETRLSPQQYLSGRFEGERPRRAAPDHVAVVVVRASQWSSWCGGSAGSCAGWLRQRRSWLTVASGAADAVAGAEEEVEADASGGLEIEIEIEIEVETDASGALAADLERSSTMQAQGRINTA